MEERPYINLKYYELQEIAEANRSNLRICEALLDELRFRTSRGALDLLEEVQERVDVLRRIGLPLLHKLLAEKNLLTLEEVSEQFGQLSISGSEKQRYVAAATGCRPLPRKTIRSLAFWNGAILGDRDIWREGQCIAIGRENFDEDYLKRAVELTNRKALDIRFMSQEDFLDFVLSNKQPGYDRGDPRIAEHPGLSFLSSIGFKWPVIGGYTGKNPLERFEGEDHDLATRYGYSVRKGVTVAARKRALNHGVQGLGLEVVAYHIAGLVRRNAGNVKMQDAVACWKADLAWLHATRYVGSIYSFTWPYVD